MPSAQRAEAEVRGLWEQTHEQTELALLARRNIRGAIDAIRQQNYGLAQMWLEEALKKLPVDTGEGGTVWPRLEEL